MSDADLLKRLRNREGFVLEGPRRLMQACEEAADTIDRLLKANADRVAELASANARIEQLEAVTDGQMRHYDGELAGKERAFQYQTDELCAANARIGELEAKYNSRLFVLGEVCLRCERAEAEVTRLTEHVRCVINERELATELFHGAEAREKALREALQKIETLNPAQMVLVASQAKAVNNWNRREAPAKPVEG